MAKKLEPLCSCGDTGCGACLGVNHHAPGGCQMSSCPVCGGHGRYAKKSFTIHSQGFHLSKTCYLCCGVGAVNSSIAHSVLADARERGQRARFGVLIDDPELVEAQTERLARCLAFLDQNPEDGSPTRRTRTVECSHCEGEGRVEQTLCETCETPLTGGNVPFPIEEDPRQCCACRRAENEGADLL